MESDFNVSRKPWGQGFTYKFLKSGERLKDQSVKDWIKSLAIPPAWKEVKISTDQKSKVLAIGRDNKERKQYIYNPNFRQKRERRKFSKMVEFGERLPYMREITSKHLKSKELNQNKVLACMVQLLDNAYFRAGSKKYAQNNNTYGLTTLRSKHLTITDSGAEFDYVGKSGKEQHREIDSSKLVKVLEELDDITGYEIFKYIDSENQVIKVTRPMLNDYIKEVMGEQFTAKDFRTWAGTYLAAILLDECGYTGCKKTNKSNLTNAINKVASILGNTPNVAKASYIDPSIIISFTNGVTISEYIKEIKVEVSDNDMTSPQEKAVMGLLNDIK